MKTLERIILLLAAIVTIIVGIATIASWPSIKDWLSKSQTTQTEESAAAKAKEERNRTVSPPAKKSDIKSYVSTFATHLFDIIQKLEEKGEKEKEERKQKEDEAKAAEKLKRDQEDAERHKKEDEEHQKWISRKYGDIIEFGQYPFYVDGKVMPIDWLVLENDGSKVLLITKKGIDAKLYNQELEDIIWENSSIRRWLNETFINNAFTAEERGKIIESRIDNKDNAEYKTRGGGVSNDKLFLLSIDEANNYFKSDKDRIADPTPYANSQLGWKCNPTCVWWLRSPGICQKNSATIKGDGTVHVVGNPVNTPYIVVRVALWYGYDLNNL